MPTSDRRFQQAGATLIELVVFIVVISIALVALLSVYQQSVTRSVDPIVRVRLLELAQSQLDVVLAQRYDQASPAGGVPACGSQMPPGHPSAPSCTGSGGVSSFDGQTDTPYPGYSRSVSVVFAGSELGLADNEAAKRITVIASAPNGEAVTLAAYRANF
jgi:MSHA pilin protein MshD